MATKNRFRYIDQLLERLECEPLPPLDELCGPERLRLGAIDDLRNAGVVLKGHHTLVEKAIGTQIEARRLLLLDFDDALKHLGSTPPGRPAQAVLRDLIIASGFRFWLAIERVIDERPRRSVGRRRRPKATTRARKRTALFFGLTADTATTTTRSVSPEQVRRAVERTKRRFENEFGPRWSRQAAGIVDTTFLVVGHLMAEEKNQDIGLRNARQTMLALRSWCLIVERRENMRRWQTLLPPSSPDGELRPMLAETRQNSVAPGQC